LKVVFNVDLILGGRDDDVIVVDGALIVDIGEMIKSAAGGLDDADANAGAQRQGDWFFGNDLKTRQDLDSVVDTLENFDGLGEIIMVNIIGGEEVEVGFNRGGGFGI